MTLRSPEQRRSPARSPRPQRTRLRHGTFALGVAVSLLLAPPALAQQAEPSVWLDVIELGRNDYERHLLAGTIARAEGRAEEAIAEFRAATLASPDRREALLLELHERVHLEHFDEVLTLTDDVAASADSSLDAARMLFFRSIALAAQGAHLEGAEALERAARYRSDLPDADLFYGNLAELHLAAGNIERAVLFFRRALSDRTSPANQVGLAIALGQLGNFAEAERLMLRAFVSDADGAFLEKPGVFFTPSGQAFAYRALLAIARGDQANALRALDAFDASEAGAAAPDGYSDALRERARQRTSTVETVSFPDCFPTQIALSPDRRRIAVQCEFAGLQERAIAGDDNARAEALIARGGDDYANNYSIMDLTYDADGQLRVLHGNGRVLVYEREGERLVLTREHHYDQPALSPAAFLDGGERVVATGARSGGFQSFAWDATGLQPQLSFSTPQSWIYFPRLSDDEQTLVWLDRTELRILRGPAWTEQGSVIFPLTDSRFAPWALSPSGNRVGFVSNGLLTIHSTLDQTPLAAIAIAGVRDEIKLDPFVGVSAVESFDDTTFVVGINGAVHITTLSSAR